MVRRNGFISLTGLMLALGLLLLYLGLGLTAGQRSRSHQDVDGPGYAAGPPALCRQ